MYFDTGIQGGPWIQGISGVMGINGLKYMGFTGVSYLTLLNVVISPHILPKQIQSLWFIHVEP